MCRVKMVTILNFLASLMTNTKKKTRLTNVRTFDEATAKLIGEINQLKMENAELKTRISIYQQREFRYRRLIVHLKEKINDAHHHV